MIGISIPHPSYADSSSTANTSQSNTKKADDLLMNAIGFLGISYRYGGASPTQGFDCSGFLQYVFKESISVNLPRRSSDMAKIGIFVTKENLQPGDLVFFNTNGRGISHVGMYVGNNNFIHSPRTGKTIEIKSMNSDYYTKRYVTARRIPEVTQAMRTKKDLPWKK